MRFFDYGEEDYIPCEICGAPAKDLHHIHGRGGKRINDVKYIIALCREHHEDSHNEKISKEQLIEIHEETIRNR